MAIIKLFLVSLFFAGSISSPLLETQASTSGNTNLQSNEEGLETNSEGYTSDTSQARHYNAEEDIQAHQNQEDSQANTRSEVINVHKGDQHLLYTKQGILTGTQRDPASSSATDALISFLNAPDQNGFWNSPQPYHSYNGPISSNVPLQANSGSLMSSSGITSNTPQTFQETNQAGMPVFSLHLNHPFYSNIPDLYPMSLAGPEKLTFMNYYSPFGMPNMFTQPHGLSYNIVPKAYFSHHVSTSELTQDTLQTQPDQQSQKIQQAAPPAQTKEAISQQSTLQNTSKVNDPLDEILPSVLTEKRRLGDEENQYILSDQQNKEQKVAQSHSQSQTHQTYNDDHFPSLITIKGRNYLVVPQKYFNPYFGGYHYGYQPYSFYNPYTYSFPVSPYQGRTMIATPVPYRQGYGLYPALYSGYTKVKVFLNADPFVNGENYGKSYYQTQKYKPNSHQNRFHTMITGYPVNQMEYKQQYQPNLVHKSTQFKNGQSSGQYLGYQNQVFYHPYTSQYTSQYGPQYSPQYSVQYSPQYTPPHISHYTPYHGN